MTKTSIFDGILGAMRSVRSASRVSRAVEGRRNPAPSDLERLGISVVAFGAINKN